MKNILIIIWIIISVSELYSQNIIDPPSLQSQQIDFNDTTVFDRNWEQNNFIKGWNWGGKGRNIDEALNINYYHQYYDSRWTNQYQITDSTQFIRNHRKIIALDNHLAGYGKNVTFNSQAITLSPVLNVDSTNNFVPRPYDSSGDVFGFNVKRNVVILDSVDHTDLNYYHSLLNKESILGDPDTIFKNIWDGTALHFLNYDTSQVSSYSSFNGTRFYLTINLKAREAIHDTLLDDVILKIRMPYTKSLDTNFGEWPPKYTYSTGYIKFDSLASASVDNIEDVDTLYNQDRGRYKSLYQTDQQNKPTEFAITGEMLRLSNPADSSLTLSAYFICDWTEPIKYNPSLTTEGTGVAEFITNLDVEVLYCGKIDLAVRYFRIECPRAQKIFRGFYDNEMKNEINTLMMNVRGNNNGVRIHRIYGNDEVSPRGYAAMRYVNMLLDTMVSLETFTWVNWGSGRQINSPKHFLHATGIKEFYCGTTIDYFNKISVPFIEYGRYDERPSSFNLKVGYKGFYNSTPPNGTFFDDTLNSEYETWLNGPGQTTLPYPSVGIYDSLWYNGCSYYNSFFSTQNYIEFQLYNAYYKNSTLIFNDKPWWANIWLTNKVIYDNTINSFTLSDIIHNYHGRAKTGEEVRLAMNNAIILGTKGLLYWFKTTMDTSGGNSFYKGFFIGLQSDTIQNPILTGDDLLYSDLIGGDFVNVNDDANGFDTVYSQGAYDWSTMGITEDRIFIGLKSNRTEINKIHKWIDENEEILMKLRLKSWLGKGFVNWNISDPNLEEDYLSKYISIDSEDWKFKRPDPESTTNIWKTESWDSAFFDLTLLKDKTKGMDTVFYIGIQNRRTDPLIYNLDGDSLQFFSSAEFEDMCGIAPVLTDASADSLYWRPYWWRRLGCREIHIPFDFKDTNNTNDYCLLKVTELGGNLYDPETPDEWWWRAPEYHHNIDTTIGQDRDLVVRLLPGEGKILKVEVLKPPKDIVGYLDHSNQSKLIAYPALRADGSESDSIQYHLTYYKPIREGSDTLGVYYSRSNIISYNSGFDAVQWENEILLSTHIYTGCVTNPSDIIDTLSCDHPSIVVRKDVYGNLKAYVVYQCNNLYSTYPYGYITETIIDVNSQDYITYNNIVSTHALAEFQGENIERPEQIINWGNPVINASSNGNYYAWSDSLTQYDPSGGIVAGYRSLDAVNYCLDDTTRIMWEDGSSTKHPSLNLYSRPNQNTTPLIWQENLYFGAYLRTKVFMTFLDFDSPSLNYDFPNGTTRIPLRQNNDSTIALVSINDYRFTDGFPTIKERFFKFWSIFWESNANFGVKVISNRDIFIDNVNDSYNSFNINTLGFNINYDAIQPNVAQGPISEYLGNNNNIIFDNDLISLNFTSNNKIYQSIKYHSFITNTNTFLSDVKIVHLANGKQPHQALNKSIPNQYQAWKNRRVFNSTTGSTPDILTSAKYYYRQSNNNDIISEGYVGFSNYYYNYYVGLANINSEILPWILPYAEVEDTINGNYYEQYETDTIKTEIFNVAPMTTADVDFILYGNNATSTTIGLLGHPSNSFTILPIPVLTPPSTAQLLQYTFLNLLDTEYRIVFINGDTTAEYTEQLIIGGLPISDTIVAKRGADYGGRIIIDLETGQTRKLTEAGKMELRVFPNPAKDEVFVTVNYPVKYLLENSDRINKAKVKFYSITGEKLFEVLARPGETIKIPTSEYTQGLYFIQAEENIDKWQLDYLAPAVERVYIER